MPAQLAELATILASYDTARAAIDGNPRLSPNGKFAEAQDVANRAVGAIEKWRTSKLDGLDRQLAAERSALLTKAGQSIAEPTPLRVQTAVQRLTGVDPLEVQALYHAADPNDQRLLEVAAEAVGRQPVRRDGGLVWEPLLPADTITETMLARADRVDAAAAASIRALQRIRNTYESVAGSARAMVNESLPHSAVA